MFDTPFGSPLDPMKRKPPVGALGSLQPLPAPPVAAAPLMAPVAPPAPAVGLAAPALPTPPASIKRKKLNPFDKEHIAQTLMEISKGFGSGGNFLQGLAAAGQNVTSMGLKLRDAEKGSTEIGGPDNAFEVHTDADGNRTFKPIPALTEYLEGKKKRESAPKPKETADYIGDMSYSIEQLDEPQRPGAYQLMLGQAREAGHNVEGFPPEYSPTFAKAMIGRTIGARQGSANEATRQYRSDVNDDRDRSWAASNARSEEASGRARAAAGRAEQKHQKSMRSAPPSSRKRKGNDDLNYF